MKTAPYKPMLAVPMSKGNVANWSDWAIEEKYDGHRLIVQVEPLLMSERSILERSLPNAVRAWGRPRKHAGSDGKTMASKQLPEHLVRALSCMPAGVYDGELIGGTTSTDVTRTDLAHTLGFVVFDVLHIHGAPVTSHSYDQRRVLLVDAVAQAFFPGEKSDVILAHSVALTSSDDVARFVDEVWKRGGEGAILKRRAARYQPDKRSPDFIKVKKLQTVVCTVVGFEPTRGKIMKRGAFATVVLEDPQGKITSVKTKDDFELVKFEREWDQRSSVTTHTDDPKRLHPGGVQTPGCHPAIGRKLRIEFQDIAADGGYRHPRWDRWEEE